MAGETFAGAARILANQLKEIKNSKDLDSISCGLVNDNNVFEWEVTLMIQDDCRYYGGTSSISPSFLFLVSPK